MQKILLDTNEHLNALFPQGSETEQEPAPQQVQKALSSLEAMQTHQQALKRLLYQSQETEEDL